MDQLQFLAAPFVASLILAGIHTYLGLHVVERGVIFVDLALAQIAALGWAVAVWYGIAPHSPQAYIFSLAFTFIGAAIFANVRDRKSNIPLEAIIGITYAVSSAATVLVMSKAVGQTEHLEHMLVGNLLFVSWPEVGKTAALYGVIGAFHYIFREAFLAVSMNPSIERIRGVSVRIWDLMFYASFGFVVTSSVSIAGVLLVFCYLIVPSVGAMLFARTIGRRLLIGWTMGALVSALGIFLSLTLDFPTGGTIVCTFGLVLVLMAVGKQFWTRFASA